MDVRAGGNYRWEWSGPTGRSAMKIYGVHKEVAAPARLVHTERMEMGPDAGPCGDGGGDCAGGGGGGGEGAGDGGGGGEPWELIATIDLTESGGQTHLKMTLLFHSKEARDMALASGMEHGVSAGYDALDQMLAK
jgi:uncharacterized protein YndB with AHSA1/START domain